MCGIFRHFTHFAQSWQLKIDLLKDSSLCHGKKSACPEEACLQMELLGHNFFMFKNAETGAVNVVYKRNEAGTYGLIEADE